jgi:hypothetical protein
MTDNLNKFNVEIASFRNNNLDYVYSYDSIGNIFIKDSSEVFNQIYLKKPAVNYVYDNEKLSHFYSLEFEEYPSQDILQSATIDYSSLVLSLNDQIQALQDQLTATGVDAGVISDLIANASDARSVIIQLRIMLGQGETEADFSDVFPYLPLNQIDPSLGPRTPIVYPTGSDLIKRVNPLSVFDLNGDFMLDQKEIKNIQQQYKIGNPILLDTLKRTTNKIPLTKTDLQYIIDTFYKNVAKIETKSSLLARLDANGDDMLSRREIRTLRQQYNIGNPVVTTFNVDGKKGLSNAELLALQRGIISGSRV